MANLGITLGILLTLLGFGAYFGTGRQSITALIPAFVGLPILALGLVARNPGRRKTPCMWLSCWRFLVFSEACAGWAARLHSHPEKKSPDRRLPWCKR